MISGDVCVHIHKDLPNVIQSEINTFIDYTISAVRGCGFRATFLRKWVTVSVLVGHSNEGPVAHKPG